MPRPPCYTFSWKTRKNLILDQFSLSTHFGCSKVPCFHSHALLILYFFSYACLFSLRLISDHRLWDSDQHMCPQLKNLFCERRFIIAVGIIETIWQTAVKDTVSGNQNPRAPETRFISLLAVPTVLTPRRKKKSDKLGGALSWLLVKERYPQENQIIYTHCYKQTNSTLWLSQKWKMFWDYFPSL